MPALLIYNNSALESEETFRGDIVRVGKGMLKRWENSRALANFFSMVIAC